MKSLIRNWKAILALILLIAAFCVLRRVRKLLLKKIKSAVLFLPNS